MTFIDLRKVFHCKKLQKVFVHHMYPVQIAFSLGKQTSYKNDHIKPTYCTDYM